MIKKEFIFFLSLFLSILVFSSCTDKSNKEFNLPSEVHLKQYGLFHPSFTDNLLENPFKQPNFWDDSLVALCRINKMEIIRRGNKKPDDIAERFEYLFDLSGRTTSFYYYNFELTDKIYSEVKYKYSDDILKNLESPVFLGKRTFQKLNIDRQEHEIRFIRNKKGKEGDTTFVFHSNGKTRIRIEKLGTFVSRVQFYLPSSQPISLLKSFLKETGVTQNEFLLAEKTVTFIDNNLPQHTYILTENFVKGDLAEEWYYGNFRELTAYKKYINNTCVKDMKFNYSSDKLLRSFENNRLMYEVNYH